MPGAQVLRAVSIQTVRLRCGLHSLFHRGGNHDFGGAWLAVSPPTGAASAAWFTVSHYGNGKVIAGRLRTRRAVIQQLCPGEPPMMAVRFNLRRGPKLVDGFGDSLGRGKRFTYSPMDARHCAYRLRSLCTLQCRGEGFTAHHTRGIEGSRVYPSRAESGIGWQRALRYRWSTRVRQPGTKPIPVEISLCVGDPRRPCQQDHSVVMQPGPNLGYHQAIFHPPY